GFACAVLARELVASGQYRAIIFEQRNHIAGNCHTTRDEDTGVMVHHYGPHIFNTSREDVWNYINRFGKFGSFVNRVKAHTKRGVFSLPINLLTINQFFQKQMRPDEAEVFIRSLGDSTILEAKTFEEQALKFLGRELYENFFYGYTKKQWGVEPRKLPASILQRLPVRFNYDDAYFNQKFQGIPFEGYTKIVEKILDHQDIEVRLQEKLDPALKKEFHHIFYSGPMDGYFDYCLGRLEYRSLIFEPFHASGDYQGNAVINYCEESIPYTRITEHKHFTPWEEHPESICFREYSKRTEADDTPYYPLRLSDDKTLLKKYLELVESEKGVTFIGRLGTYRYLDMHIVIGESLDLAKICLSESCEDRWPKFSKNPI
ncbi:MAG: UDP-galactopyranose mutase, partial [Bacteriovoracaceae bacterium]|nr:UDP-galactopyranose mutase [Bacteriovoracaceae bacterium]